jgi:electron transfer flavoprotein alpha subunit
MSVLVIAEHDNKTLNAVTLNIVTAATKLGGDIHVLVAGQGASPVAEASAKVGGVTKVLLADDVAYANQLAEPLSLLITGLASSYTAVMAPATAFGRDFLPRVAALLDVAQISDITGIISPDTFVRPIYAGAAMATVRSNDAIKVITVRGTSFDPAPTQGIAAPIEPMGRAEIPPGPVFVSQQLVKSERPDLAAARVIVTGGRGLAAPENFNLVETLADALGAAVGATRAAADAGYAPHDLMVGQTGKIVAPELYVAIGVSGAIQHLAGMKDSKVIVAINKDEEAPIFQFADYGLVADLFQAVPELQSELAK